MWQENKFQLIAFLFQSIATITGFTVGIPQFNIFVGLLGLSGLFAYIAMRTKEHLIGPILLIITNLSIFCGFIYYILFFLCVAYFITYLLYNFNKLQFLKNEDNYGEILHNNTFYMIAGIIIGLNILSAISLDDLTYSIFVMIPSVFIILVLIIILIRKKIYNNKRLGIKISPMYWILIIFALMGTVLMGNIFYSGMNSGFYGP